MKFGLQGLPLSSLIRRNWLDTEMRASVNALKVEQYAAEMKDGDAFPPPVVFIDPKTELIRVGDGFHRILAYQRNRWMEVPVDLQRGSRTEAFLHNIEANRKQKGLPFGFGDYEKCILTLMQDEQTRKWTQTRIAEVIGCSIGYVSQVVNKFADVIERPDQIIDKNGVVRSKAISKAKEDVAERRAEAIDLFAEGVPKIEISRRLKIARWAVQRYIYDATHEKQLTDCPHCNGTGKIQLKK